MKITDVICKRRLSEATFDLDAQVDYLWDNYLADINDIWVRGRIPPQGGTIFVIDSSDLPPSDAIEQANSINPVSIEVNSTHGNVYQPQRKLVAIGFNQNATTFVVNYGGLNKAIEVLLANGKEQMAKNLANEFTETRLKGGAYHELSHWLDDSLHGRHLGALVAKVGSARTRRDGEIVLRRGKPDVALTKHEIDAQVHGLKAVKRKNEDIWDSLTFLDVIALVPSLMTIMDRGIDEGWFDEWKRALTKRLHREGMLGKQMR